MGSPVDRLIVLDTHTWVWWAAELPGLSTSARRELEQAARVGVCTISCWELGLLVKRGSVDVEPDLRSWVARALALDRVEELPLTADIAVAAASLEEPFPRDPADRIIYSTTTAHDALLLTKDRAIRRYAPSRTIW